MPLIVDPALQAEVIRQFNLRGELAPFNLTENVVPVFDIGKLVSTVVPQEVVTPGLNLSARIGLDVPNRVLRVGPADYEAAEIFTDTTVAPGAATVLASTGAITAAGPRAFLACAGHNDNAPLFFDLQWRDAADAVTLASFPFAIVSELSIAVTLSVALNERLRWVNTTAVVGTAVSFISSASASTAIAT